MMMGYPRILFVALALALVACSGDKSEVTDLVAELSLMDADGGLDVTLSELPDVPPELDVQVDVALDVPLDVPGEVGDLQPELVDAVELVEVVAPDCVEAADCEDGDYCTVDKCVAGECLHQDKNCNDSNKCTEDWCDAETGQCQHEASQCDDGNPCTWDSCLPGTGCEHEAIPDCCPGTLKKEEAFEGNFSWTVVSEFAPENASATWQLSDARAHAGESSLYFGSLESQNYDFGGRLRVFAETLPVVLSADVASEVRFWLWMNVEPSISYDTFTVFVVSESGMVPVYGKETMLQMKKWKPVSVDLKAFRGQTIKVRFVFDSIDGHDNTYEGVYIDDYQIWQMCPDQGCITKVECNDGQVCTTDTCDNGVCKYTFTEDCCMNLGDCLDSDPCTIDACKDNVCEPLVLSPPYCCYQEEDCDDDNVCTTDICDGGICLHPPSQAPGCCESNLDCDDGNPCTDNICNPDDSSCYFPFNTVPCNDSNKCTKNDHCIEGSCGGDPVVCSDGNNCTYDKCDPQNGCYHPNIPQGAECDDLNNCTVSDVCLLGECAGDWLDGCCLKDVDCDDSDGCTIDKCNDNECQNINTCCFSDEECNDFDDICSIDACVEGACVYTPTGVEGCCHEVLFRDDFSTDKGWSFDGEWERGTATPSSGQSYGSGDPSSDHSGSSDNFHIGVVIGGNAAKVIHGYYWATSPVVDTLNASNLRLHFWRMLNSDYSPYMVNAVDVYNGSGWKRIFESGSAPGIQDSTWVFQNFDVTAHKNSTFQVRFGFTIGSSGVFTVSSWNVDDVVLVDMPANGPGLCCAYDSDCAGVYPGTVPCQGGMCAFE
jgi:hypothetical protein